MESSSEPVARGDSVGKYIELKTVGRISCARLLLIVQGGTEDPDSIYVLAYTTPGTDA